jgi:hypothetical protein
LTNKINSFYETNFNLNEQQLYVTIHKLILEHVGVLKRQGLNHVNITLDQVASHFQNCHLSEKNIIARDVREICRIQNEIADDASKITSWIKLVALKATLLKALKNKTDSFVDTPYEFS